MFDHIGVHVSNYQRSLDFYSAVLPVLGFELLEDNRAGDVRWMVFGADSEAPFLVVAFSPDREVHPVHIGLSAHSQAAVQEFYRAGLSAGGTDNGPPGPRDAGYPYYAAFLLDPDGLNIEAGFRGSAV